MDDILRERLHDIEIRDGLPDWGRIERSVMAIEKEERKKRFFLFRTISGYAATVLILIGIGIGGYFILHDPPVSIDIVSETVEKPVNGSVGSIAGSVDTREVVEGMDTFTGNVGKPQKETIETIYDSPFEIVAIEDEVTKLPGFDGFIAESPVVHPFFSAVSELVVRDNVEMYDIESYMAGFYELYGEEEEEKGDEWNFLFMADALTVNRSVVSYDNELEGLSINGYTGVPFDNNNLVFNIDRIIVNNFIEDFGDRAVENTIYGLNHRFPLSLGVWFGRDIGGKWDLVSGLIYSYMESYAGYESWTSIIYEQQLQYVGIPLSLSYSLLPERSLWNVDLRGGVTAEKALSAKGVTTVYENYIVTGYSVNEDVPSNIMYSANLGFGFGYTLFRGFGLYAEPALGYYFYTKGQPVSYKTDNPFRFNIRAGVRLDF